jgi:tetratricopeptide (TPR) repeat protein
MKWFKKKRKLDDAVHHRITVLSEEGSALADDGDYAGALKKYWEAFALLPEPKNEWEAATWLLGSIGDANFLAGDFNAGRDNLSMAMTCPDAIGNPFLHLRLGQCHFELGALDKAADELVRAYMGAGKEIFDEDDAKYFDFLTTTAKAPPGGW